MALSRVRRYRGLGAFDSVAWAAYQDALRSGQPYLPNATLEDPNGGIIHFDSEGLNDYYTPPPQYSSGQPTDSLPATKDPSGTFYGWTNYQVAAYWAAQGSTGQLTDKVKASGVLQPGSNVLVYDPAVIAANDAELRAYAQTDPLVRAALEQLKTGAFRGTAGQAAYDANEALAITRQAESLLRDWLAFRDNMIRQNPANASMPIMPPLSNLPPMPEVMSPAVYEEIKRLVAKLPPQPAPQTTTTTPTVPQTTTTTTTAPSSYPSSGFVQPSPSSGGMSPGPGSGGVNVLPVLRDAPPLDLYPEGPSFGTVTGSGPGGGASRATVSGGAGGGGLPWGLIAAGVAALFVLPKIVKPSRRKR